MVKNLSANAGDTGDAGLIPGLELCSLPLKIFKQYLVKQCKSNKGKLKNIKKKTPENQGYVLCHTYLNQECITNPVLFPYFLKNISIYK